ACRRVRGPGFGRFFAFDLFFAFAFFFGFLTGVLGAFGFFFGAFLGFDRPAQGEDPEVFAVRRRRQRVAAGVDREFLFAFVLEGGHGRVGAGAGLEAPEHFAGFGAESLQHAVVLAGEDEAAGGRHRARIAGFGEFFLPGDLAGRHVVRRQKALGVEPG